MVATVFSTRACSLLQFFFKTCSPPWNWFSSETSSRPGTCYSRNKFSSRNHGTSYHRNQFSCKSGYPPALLLETSLVSQPVLLQNLLFFSFSPRNHFSSRNQLPLKQVLSPKPILLQTQPPPAVLPGTSSPAKPALLQLFPFSCSLRNQFWSRN